MRGGWRGGETALTAALAALLWGAVGLLVGGVLSVLASRLPGRLPLLGWPPRCHANREPLEPRDVLPVVGWLAQGGVCRHCGGRLDFRYPLMEALCGLTFGLLWWRFGPGAEALIGSLYAAVLWLIFTVDWQHHLILNKVTYPAIPGALLLSFIYPRTNPTASLIGLLVCGGVFGVLYALGMLIYRGRPPLGLGDVKLAALIGAMLGVAGGPVALALGIAAGGLQAIGALLLGYKRRRTFMPYGTALVAGTIVALFYGHELLALYLFGR